MSDTSRGEGWWLASDGRWYPPESSWESSATPSDHEGFGGRITEVFRQAFRESKSRTETRGVSLTDDQADDDFADHDQADDDRDDDPPARWAAEGEGVPLQGWRGAEEYVASWLRSEGFDARLTQRGSDGGIDIDAGTAVAQVKHQAQPVGRPAVQQLAGAAIDAPGLFFSSSGYTSQAQAWAEQTTSVALFIFDLTSDEVTLIADPAGRYAGVRPRERGQRRHGVSYRQRRRTAKKELREAQRELKELAEIEQSLHNVKIVLQDLSRKPFKRKKTFKRIAELRRLEARLKKRRRELLR